MTMEKWIGKTLGKYQLEKLLGEGSSGAVYQARNIELGKVFAIKILLPALLYGEKGERATKRFFREAQTAGRLSHPNIVQVFDVEEEEGVYYLVMEFIDGQSLEKILFREGAFSLDKSLEIIKTVGQGLNIAHEQGIIHQDIKPGNILMTSDGIPKITDFGLARCLTGDVTQMSATGTIVGTPLYISPEQILGTKTPTPACDIYSLGATLFYMLTDEPPFQGESAFVILQKHIHEPVPKISEIVPEISPKVDELISKMMAKQPENRLGTIPQFLEAVSALENALQNEQTQAKTKNVFNVTQPVAKKVMTVKLRPVNPSSSSTLNSESYTMAKDIVRRFPLQAQTQTEQIQPSLQTQSAGIVPLNYDGENSRRTPPPPSFEMAGNEKAVAKTEEHKITERRNVHETKSLPMMHFDPTTMRSLEERMRPDTKSVSIAYKEEGKPPKEKTPFYYTAPAAPVSGTMPGAMPASGTMPGAMPASSAVSHTPLPMEIAMPGQKKSAPFEQNMVPTKKKRRKEGSPYSASALREKNGFWKSIVIACLLGLCAGYGFREALPQMRGEIPNYPALEQQTMELCGYGKFEESISLIKQSGLSSDLQNVLRKKVLQMEQDWLYPARSGWFGENMPDGMTRSKNRGEYLWLNDRSKMVYVQAGEFVQGSEQGLSAEKPVRVVFLDGYYIDKYEVTNEQYRLFLSNTGYPYQPVSWYKEEFRSSNKPVVGVSWDDATAYAKWADKRMLTEAEWEKASRGAWEIPDWSKPGKRISLSKNILPTRKYPWGNTLNENKANYIETRADNRSISPVGEFQEDASPYGCMDMAGNVKEWCQDRYSDNYYSKEVLQNPKGPEDERYKNRVCRGGSWKSREDSLLTYRRINYNPASTYDDVGFRLAK